MSPVDSNTIPVDYPHDLVKWSVDWKIPLKMTALLLAGGALAVGHHLFYRSLSGKLVQNNEDENSWSMGSHQSNVRYGTAFAFATKICLASAVTLAFQQQIWISFRKKYLKISTLDAMFQATSDPFSFANIEFISKSKLGAVLAAVIWLLPLSALVTPTALTVVSDNTISTSMMSVPMINGSADSFNSQGRVDMTSPAIKRLTTAMVSGAQILNMPVFKPNSSYTTTFNITSLQCSPANATIQPIIDGVFNALGSYPVYAALSPFTEVAAYWPGVDDQGMLNMSDLWSWNFTDWTSSCAAKCILGSDSCSYISLLTDMTVFPLWYPLWLRLGDDRLACSLQHTRYTIEFEATGGAQTIKFPISSELLGEVTERDYYIPVIQPLLDILTGGAYVALSVCNMADAEETHCTSDALLSVAKTGIQETALVGPFTQAAANVFAKASDETSVSDGAAAPNLGVQESSPTVGPSELALARNMTIGPLIEELSRNLTLSLFSNDIFLSNNYPTTVYTTSARNVYLYKSRNLVIAYSIAFFVASLCILVGFRAIIANGIVYNTSFSTTLSTTRNPVFDVLTLGSSLGGTSIEKQLLDVKIPFGLLDGENDMDLRETGTVLSSHGSRRAAFGLQDTVAVIRKGDACQ